MNREEFNKFEQTLDIESFKNFSYYHTDSEIVERYGISHGNLRELRKKYDIHTPRDISSKKRKSTWEDKSVKKLEELTDKVSKSSILQYYEIENHSWDECLVKFDVTNSEFIKLLDAYDIHKSKEKHTAKIKESKLKKYNNENYNNRDKARETCLEKYGVDNPWKSEEVINSMKLNRDYDKIQEKIRQTNLEKYGVGHHMQREEIREKVANTNLEKYGVDNPWKSEEVKKKIYIPEHQKKINDTKRRNNTFNTSYSEERCAIKLGTNIIRQYSDKRYPYACDFYLKDKDLFIECNFSWTHGGLFFDEFDDRCVRQLKKWQKHSEESKYYKNAIETWTVRDVKKLNTAKENNLNYIVFWSEEEVDVWLDMGCPIGKDYERPYSWVIERKLSLDYLTWPNLTSGSATCTKIAKKANWEEFYKRELELWKNNLGLQCRLYINRKKYINKGYNDLSDLEILRGLNISREIVSYSTFNNDAFVKFLNKYNIRSVYDPCAGWGERLTTCASLGIKYVGIDINSKVVNGDDRIIEHYSLGSDYKIICGDSSIIQNNTSSDCIFTCPPYFNQEIYTDFGAENLSKDEFLIWWETVVKNATNDSVKYFAYQINQKNKDSLNEIILKSGFEYVESINLKKQASHYNKIGKNLKKDYESVEIFIKNC